MYIRMILILLCAPLTVLSKTGVVTSTADLAYFAREIGGDQVEAEAIARPTADVHFIEVRPSYMVKVTRADVAFKVGLELDLWFERVVDGSRNNDLIIVDCSKYIEPLEVPSFKADARYGDLHRYGNPHYWTGPQNVEELTRAILEGLSEADPENADAFESNRERLLKSIKEQLGGIEQRAQPLEGAEIIYYHNTWPYFNEYFGSVSAEFVEPYPGVPPSPSHIKHLIDFIKGHGIKVIAMEPYFDRRVPERLARETGAQVVTVYPSVGGRDADETYIEWLRGNVNTLIEALR